MLSSTKLNWSAETGGNWRKLMLSLALVCRAWSRPALDTLYKDFGPNRNAISCDVLPYALRLAKTLKYHPALGGKIRVLNTSTFFPLDLETEDDYWDKAEAISTILQTAKNITQLRSFGTHRILAQDFVRTLCSCSNLREVTVMGEHPCEPAFVYIPSIGDILRCMSHWPLVCRLKLWEIPSAIASDDLPTSTCTITFVSLQSISLDLSQLRLLTTSWKSALREARIINISGITNKDIRMWLSEVGPTLEIICFDSTEVRNHRSINEEYAVDAMLPIMSNLVILDLKGDIASHLVLERFVPASDAIPGRQYKLWMLKVPGLIVNSDRFLNALNTTAWTEINETGLLRGELLEEARRIATRRNICFTKGMTRDEYLYHRCVTMAK